MAWGKLEDTFCDDEKFDELADALGISEIEAMGHTACLWSWCLRHAPDGDLSGKSPRAIARRGAKWTGDPQQYIDAMVSVRLMDRDGDTLRLHNWMMRAESHKRATQKQRERERKRRSPDSRETVARQSLDGRENVAEERRGEERRREEKREREGLKPVDLKCSDKPPPPGSNDPPHTPTGQVLKHYDQIYPGDPESSGIGDGRRNQKRIVDKALRRIGVDDCLAAIDGNKLDATAQSKGHTGLRHILDSSQTPRYIRLGRQSQAPPVDEGEAMLRAIREQEEAEGLVSSG